MRVCSVPSRGDKHRGLGYCIKHLARFKRHGSPYGGRTSPGEPLGFIETVVLSYDGSECLTWPFNRSRRGYPILSGHEPSTQVGRIICERVHGPAPSDQHQARHLCGKGHEGCCSPRHLVWGTPSENEQDKLIHGTHLRGERAPQNKLAEAEAREILRLKGKITQRDLAKRFGVTAGAIAQIHRRKNWAWL